KPLRGRRLLSSPRSSGVVLLRTIRAALMRLKLSRGLSFAARTEPFLPADRRTIHQANPPKSGLKPKDSAAGRLLLFAGVFSGVLAGFRSDELGDALH